MSKANEYKKQRDRVATDLVDLAQEINLVMPYLTCPVEAAPNLILIKTMAEKILEMYTVKKEEEGKEDE